MNNPNSRLISARKSSGLTPAEVAKLAGLPTAAYYDVEMHQDEIFQAISICDLNAICDVFGITIAELFSRSSNAPEGDWNLIRLSEAIELYLSVYNRTIVGFEDQVGWEVGEFLRKRSTACGWTVDCLRDVCDAVGADWLTILRNEKFSDLRSRDTSKESGMEA